MPASAAAAAAPAQAAPGGGNPFQLASNWYAEKNNQGGGSSIAVSATAQTNVSGAINAGQYLRQVRLIVRTGVAGTVATAAATTDMPFNILTQVDLVNVDGSEILYNMGGFS